MHHIFACGFAAIGQAHRVAKSVKETTFEQFLLRNALLDQVFIGHGLPLKAGHQSRRCTR
jgi:hypothetical protein